MELRSKVRRLKAAHNIGLVVIDYLQLMSYPGKKESRQQEISEISRSIKALAREMDIPIIATTEENNVEAKCLQPQLLYIHISISFIKLLLFFPIKIYNNP